MIIADMGVAPNSSMDFCIPSSFAQDNLYYVQQYGTFHCDSRYHVERDYLDSYLLFYLLSGTLHIETGGVAHQAGADQIVLLDCHLPHSYYCLDECSFMWFHFNGNSSSAYVSLIGETGGLIFGDGNDRIRLLRDQFESIFFYAQKIPADEHIVSLGITNILSSLASHSSMRGITNKDHPLWKTINYISANYAETITTADLAEMCALSESHFIRVFQKYENMTPHEYIVSYRLKEAKRLLQTTDDSIESIAEQCGFNSASHFARAFRKNSGISPTDFRNILF